MITITEFYFINRLPYMFSLICCYIKIRNKWVYIFSTIKKLWALDYNSSLLIFSKFFLINSLTKSEFSFCNQLLVLRLFMFIAFGVSKLLSCAPILVLLLLIIGKLWSGRNNWFSLLFLSALQFNNLSLSAFFCTSAVRLYELFESICSFFNFFISLLLKFSCCLLRELILKYEL